VLLAAYESRYLFGYLSHGLPAVRGLVPRADLGVLATLAVMALGAAVLLREMGRGSRTHAPHPRWSAELLGLWLLCSAALLACFCCEQLGRGSAVAGEHVGLLRMLSAGGWPSVASALFVGFQVAASLECARWALRAVARWLRPPLAAAVASPASIIRPASPAPLRLASIANGWCSRGPPRRIAVAVGLS
jgi:hypothetical protein